MEIPQPLLIRHAESAWNAQGRWQGHGDPPLSARGRAQAAALAGRLRTSPIDVLVASDLRRALATASILGVALGLQPEREPRLRELDVGSWTGLTRAEIEERDPRELACFESGDPRARPGGGESRDELRERAAAAVAEIAGRHPGRRLALVTHLGVIRALCPGADPANAEVCRMPGGGASPTVGLAS